MSGNRRRASRVVAGAGAAGLLAVLLVAGSPARGDHLFVVTSDGVTGNCAAIDLGPPWSAVVDLEPVGSSPVVRHFLGKHWVVNGTPDDEVQVIDPATFETVLRFSAGAATDPRDVAVVDDTTAYVSRYDSTWLLRVNAATGAPVDSIDLGGFADPDGLPEMAWMELDGTRLFVQIQRIDRLVSGTTVPPALLAVIDVTTNTLIDVDPGRPGVQGIELAGPIPGSKMQRRAAERRLTVSTPGVLLDGTGGIEEIDLDALANLGFVLSEKGFALDLGPHVIVSPSRGYVVGHTDFALSSHLVAFSIPDGAFLGESHVTFTFVESLAHDPVGGFVFFPDPEPLSPGVLVFDAATGAAVAGPIGTGLPPVDLVVVREAPTAAPAAPPDEGARLVVVPNPAQGETRLRFRAPRDGWARATVHDVAGRLVHRLDATRVTAGPATIAWDGRDASGRRLPPGVYVVRLEAPGLRAAAKVHRTR